MDYQALALKLMERMYLLRQGKPHRQLSQSMQGEHFVIQYIAHHGGSVQPGEISNSMGISSARIAAALNSLERKGLVTREIDVNDRRKILVDLTEAGEALAAAQTKRITERITHVLTSLGENDAEELVRLSGRLLEIMKEIKHGECTECDKCDD